ncbi:MAG TPA: hypothetical protein VG742_00555 [Dongiaceae bacterium]|nr:hypothetical protein [Dongiaceae bacterium]
MVLQLATAFALAGCENYESDIQAVQQATILPGLSNEELVMDLAGERASAEWDAESSDRDGVIEVIATINRVGQAGKRSTIELHYSHDRNTKSVTLDRVLLNGKRQGLASGAIDLNNLNLFKLQLN